jgi:hypothetical protein
MPKLIRCDRCGRRYRGQDDWNVTASMGRIVGFLCSSCQTPEENAEAAIKEATLDYRIDYSSGLIYTFPKINAE